MLLYGEPQVNRLSSILWLVMNASLFSIIPLSIARFEHGCITLARTTICLKIGQTLNSLSFECFQRLSIPSTHSQIFQVQVRNLSGSIKGAASTKICPNYPQEV